MKDIIDLKGGYIVADIYLTKKERTTLYTEGLIYSIFVVLAAYFTIYGGLFIKMLPMLFILGIIGRCIFDKPKTTLILGTIAIFLTGFVNEFKIDLNLILSMIYSAFAIFLGLKVGKHARTLYYSYKLRVFIGYNKKVVIIAYLIFLTILAIFLNSVINSNPIQYIIAKNKTDKFIKETYGEDRYKIQSVKYNIKNRGGYTFNVIVAGKEVVLVHKTLDSIEDSNLQQRKEECAKVINKKIDTWIDKSNIDKEVIVGATYSYSKISLEPDTLEINIKIDSGEKVEVDSEKNILNALDCINKLNTFDEYKNIAVIKLNIDGKSMNITREKILEGVTKEYIQKGLQVEYLD